MRSGMTAVILAAAVAMLTSGVQAAPKPSDARIAWELEFDFQDIQSIQVRLPGEDKMTTFWFLRYSIANRNLDTQTRQPTEQYFIPEFVLYTDTGQVIRSGYKVPHVVFETIKKQFNNPLLKDQSSITGKILYGDDNAKDGVAIWPAFDPKAGKVDIFVGGLSGEVLEMKLPKPITVKEKNDKGEVVEVTKETVKLVKTFHLEFEVPGEFVSRLQAKCVLKKKEWIMR